MLSMWIRVAGKGEEVQQSAAHPMYAVPRPLPVQRKESPHSICQQGSVLQGSPVSIAPQRVFSSTAFTQGDA